MGTVTDLARHARASAALNPKTAGSASILSFANASEKARKFSGGIIPLAFQLLTADGPTPASVATADVPPRASITASAVQSMSQISSRSVNLSRLHALAIDFTGSERFNAPMRSRDDIAERLRITQEALGLIAADLCEVIDCKPNRWSQYTSETSKRRITEKVANALCDQFSLTLDWIYRGNPAGLPHDLRMKIAKITKQAA